MPPRSRYPNIINQYHKLDRIRISNVYLGEGNDTPVLVMRRFKDAAEAMKYYEGVQRQKKDFINSSMPYKLFPISQSNYREVLKARSDEGYNEFFQANY